MARKKNIWLHKVGMKKGGLRNQLNVPKGKTIPPGVLDKLAEGNVGTHVQYRGKSVKITPKMKKRAVLARTMKSWRK
jgi:hypothetical protein